MLDLNSNGICYVHEPSIPHLIAVVTDPILKTFPSSPETGTVVITLAQFPETNQVVDAFTFEGRNGLLAWYETHVGYNPDSDGGKPTPILNLIDTVAGLLLLYAGEAATSTN